MADRAPKMLLKIVSFQVGEAPAPAIANPAPVVDSFQMLHHFPCAVEKRRDGAYPATIKHSIGGIVLGELVGAWEDHLASGTPCMLAGHSAMGQDSPETEEQSVTEEAVVSVTPLHHENPEDERHSGRADLDG